MTKLTLAASVVAVLGLAATACSSGPLASASSGSSMPLSQQCAGLSNPELQECLNGDTSQHLGNRATGGAGGTSTAGPGLPGTSGGGSGPGMK